MVGAIDRACFNFVNKHPRQDSAKAKQKLAKLNYYGATFGFGKAAKLG